MGTQVTDGKILDEVAAKIGRELNIDFQKLSMPASRNYRPGQWLYDDTRPDIEVSRWLMSGEQIVEGPTWGETDNAYRQRIERELREALNDLLLLERNS